jgi:putative ABC transport system permease protein
MQPGSPVSDFPGKMRTFLKKYLGDQANAGMLNQTFSLQPITDVHLYSNLKGEIGAGGDIATVYILATLTFFIVLLACINFMNMATARSAHRAKEVGLRKVCGARRQELILQFVGEAMTLSFIALVLALALADLTLPLFNELADRRIVMDLMDGRLWLMALGIAVTVGLLSGSYPALFLSGFQPITAIKGIQPSGSTGIFARRVLVTLQFAISIALIIGAGMALRQMDYLRSKSLGFDRDSVVVLRLTDAAMGSRYTALKQTLSSQNGVVSVAGSSSVPGEQTLGRYLMRPADAGDNQTGAVAAIYTTDYSYVQTLGLELVSGRNFSSDIMADAHETALINESAVRAMGLTSPVGAQIELSVPLTRTVIGVVRDFHTQSLHHPIEPVMLIVGLEGLPNAYLYTLVRIRGTSLPQTLENIRRTWEEIYPDYPFEYTFLDQDLDNLYRAEERMQRIFSAAALVSVLIACLGVFGLASFMVERRIREIGVRKVIGASMPDIIGLLTLEYVWLTLIANLIAWPVAYGAMSRWLQDFAYQVAIDFGVFVLAGTLILSITLLTTGYHVMKAARMNPIKSLRYE